MLGYNGFIILIIFSILAPIAGAITLLLMLVFERELDLLKSQNHKLKLEKELQQMEYLQLGQQIQPHFLFNTLNLLLNLARSKRFNELIKSLESLSMFLRFTYRRKDQLNKIEEELQFTMYYLEIQKLRFGERLKVFSSCPEDMMRMSILPYLLQTLVENSFKHGLERKSGEAILTICFSQIDDKVTLSVKDNGSADIEVPQVQEGQGLRNIQRRLQLLFKEKGTLNLLTYPGEGTEVVVSWPLIYRNEPELEQAR